MYIIIIKLVNKVNFGEVPERSNTMQYLQSRGGGGIGDFLAHLEGYLLSLS